MALRNSVLYLVLATAAIAASGCSRTLVAALPVGTTTTCDPAWPGRWSAIPSEDTKGKHDKKVWLEINADCSVMTSIEDHGKREREDHRLTLVSTRAGDFLRISDGDGKPECIGDGTAHCGMELMRYVHDGNEIRLYNPDHGAVHAAIADGRVPGYSEADGPKAKVVSATDTTAAPTELANSRETPATSSDKTHFNNLIAGDPEQITTILEQHPEFFESVPWITLKRDTHPNRAKHR